MEKDLKGKEPGKGISRKVRDYTQPDLQIGLERENNGPLNGQLAKISMLKSIEIKEFIGGNIKDEIRNRYYEADFINVHISC